MDGMVNGWPPRLHRGSGEFDSPTVYMNVEEQRLFSSTVFQLTTYIWDIVVRARRGYADSVDFERGDLFAANLTLMMNWYKESKYTFLPETTCWLANEVVVTLRDTEGDHSKQLTFKS